MNDYSLSYLIIDDFEGIKLVCCSVVVGIVIVATVVTVADTKLLISFAVLFWSMSIYCKKSIWVLIADESTLHTP